MSEMIIESSGNVFTDLGFEPGEAAILQMRAKLMNDLREHIQASRMTQTEAAQRLGVGQSRVSDLMRGKWEKFSLEMLITLEARMGRQVILEFPDLAHLKAFYASPQYKTLITIRQGASHGSLIAIEGV
jgi:predicted XRE-type DNA-binding protein